MEFFQEPPKGLDITGFIRNIWVLHIYPIAHLVGEVFPFAGKLHHVLTALGIVFSDADLLTNVYFRNTQILLHAQLYREAVRIPSGLALHAITLHRFITTEKIFDRTSHHVMDARVAVSRGRAIIKNIVGFSLAGAYAFVK